MAGKDISGTSLVTTFCVCFMNFNKEKKCQLDFSIRIKGFSEAESSLT